MLPHKIWADCVKCPKFPGVTRSQWFLNYNFEDLRFFGRVGAPPLFLREIIVIGS